MDIRKKLFEGWEGCQNGNCIVKDNSKGVCTNGSCKCIPNANRTLLTILQSRIQLLIDEQIASDLGKEIYFHKQKKSEEVLDLTKCKKGDKLVLRDNSIVTFLRTKKTKEGIVVIVENKYFKPIVYEIDGTHYFGIDFGDNHKLDSPMDIVSRLIKENN